MLSARKARIGPLARFGGWLLLALLAGACAEGPPPEASAAADTETVSNRGADTANWWGALPRPEWAAFPRVPSASDWFEVYEVGPGVLAIHEPGQFEEVNSYLIIGAERALLFDSGLGIGNIRRVVDELTELPVVLLNSHSHYDHIGGNHLFTTIYGPDDPYTAERSAGVEHERVKGMVAPAWIWKPLPPGFDADAYRIEPYEITEFVGEGSVIDLGGRRLEVLMTPGHAPDALCLLLREERLLFTGDTFYPAPLYTHIPGGSFDDYVASAERLAALEPLVDYLFPGHNVGRVASSYLGAMAAAFDTISAGRGEYVETDGNRQYAFDGFSIIVAPPSAAP